MSGRIHIVRHGNTFGPGETVRRVGARTDLALSASGQAQARDLGAHFRECGITFTTALAGPLQRTVETGEAILAAQPAPPELEIVESLREIDYGPDEGRCEAAVLARIGPDALAAWECDGRVPPGWAVDPRRRIADWRALFDRLRGGTGQALVVTSNGVARFARLAAGDRAGETEVKLRTGAYGIIDLEGAGAQVAAWNLRP